MARLVVVQRHPGNARAELPRIVGVNDVRDHGVQPQAEPNVAGGEIGEGERRTCPRRAEAGASRACVPRR